MKNSLASGYAFVVGISIYDSFESQKVAKTGVVPMPNFKTENCLGGHAVLVVGYSDKEQHWIVRNSWGSTWGDKGYFYLPYIYLLDAKLSSDLWNITRISTVPNIPVSDVPIIDTKNITTGQIISLKLQVERLEKELKVIKDTLEKF
jgi:hypothetical protein